MNFFDHSSAGAAAFTVLGESSMNFSNNSTAGTATITAGLPVSQNGGFDAGFIKFFNNSTAGSATISALDGSNIEFHDGSNAGTAILTAGSGEPGTSGFIFFNEDSTADHATVTVNSGGQLVFSHNDGGEFLGGPASAGDATITTKSGGQTLFENEGSGGNARFITDGGGIVDISALRTNGTTAGSIEGAGTYALGSKQLTVGSNNLSTTVSGTITDGGAAGGVGGSLVKVGTGTLTLTGVNPYTGGTTVSGGALVVGDFANPAAALSGGGPISVGSGGTLGGYGSVTGPVTNSGVIAAGNATPGFAASPTGTFTIVGNLLNQGAIQLASGESIGNVLEVRGGYTGAGGTMAINTFLGGDDSRSDRLVINGDPAATGNTSVHVTNVGGPGAFTTANGILVVNAINGATTAPGAFTREGRTARRSLRLRSVPRRRYPSQRQRLVPALDLPRWRRRRRRRGGGGGGGGGGGVLPPIPPFPIDPPPNPLPPNVEFPIIGPELATYGVVQPLARQLGLSILGTLDDRVGDTYEPDGCAVAPAPETSSVDLPTRKNTLPTRKPGLAPCPLFAPSVWGRFFGQTVNNRYQAFADPRASGNLGGFQGGIDLLRGSLIAGHSERAGLYGAYGNVNSDVTGLVTNPAATAYVLSRAGSMSLNAWSVGGYWTHVGPGGWYLDAVLQGTWYYGSASTQFARLNTKYR